MDNWVALGVGIVSSLMATAVFIVFSEFIRRIAIPKFRDLVYRGVRLDGRWELDTTKVKTQYQLSSVIELTQRGNSVSGTYIHKHESTKEITTYEVKGDIRDMYLIFTMQARSKQQLDCAVMMFQIASHENSLVINGGMLMRNDPTVAYISGLSYRLCS